MSNPSSKNTVWVRVVIVVVLLAAVAGVLYAKQARKTPPPSCPCSGMKH